MREIKFRAWETEYSGGEMVYFDFFSIDGGILPATRYTCVDLGNEKNIVMQYTGLKDKNGKEIYEGDVMHSRGYEVIYRNCQFVIRRLHDNKYIYFPLYVHSPAGTGVIGNIYENPELMEKEEC